MTKAKIVFFCLFLFHSLSWGQKANETYPNKPIRLIVPLAAGSSVDTAARIVMQRVSQNIGQSIIIENKLGAAGIIGADQVAKSAPDGYTLGGFNDSIITMIPNLNPKLPWDIVKDFESISQVAIIEWGLMVSSSSPYRNVNDLIEAAKNHQENSITALVEMVAHSILAWPCWLTKQASTWCMCHTRARRRP